MKREQRLDIGRHERGKLTFRWRHYQTVNDLIYYVWFYRFRFILFISKIVKHSREQTSKKCKLTGSHQHNLSVWKTNPGLVLKQLPEFLDIRIPVDAFHDHSLMHDLQDVWYSAREDTRYYYLQNKGYRFCDRFLRKCAAHLCEISIKCLWCVWINFARSVSSKSLKFYRIILQNLSNVRWQLPNLHPLANFDEIEPTFSKTNVHTSSKFPTILYVMQR